MWGSETGVGQAGHARDQDKKRVEFIVHGLEESVQAIPVQLNDLMNNILQRRIQVHSVGNA